MKKILILLLFAIVSVVPMFAQEKGGLTDKQFKEFREYKMKFLSKEMALNEATRKKFETVYEQLSNERHPVRTEIRLLSKKIKNNTATEADYARLNKLKEDEMAIEKKYDDKFSEFLSGKQVFQLKEAEAKFKEKIKEMKAKRDKRKKR